MSGIYDSFSGSITGEVLTFNPDAIPEPETLHIRMTRGEHKIANEMRKAFGGFRRVVIDVDGERHEFGADSLIRLLEGYESCGQVPEQTKREDGGERKSYGEACGDDRFELIAKAKAKLLDCTNIESRPEEVAVLDSILYRCWQMGWLDKLRDGDSRYSELFGTPERAARTLLESTSECRCCVIRKECGYNLDKCVMYDRDALLGWLRGESE